MSLDFWKCPWIKTTLCVSDPFLQNPTHFALVDKSKLVILKLRKLYIVIPFTMAKIEVRVRNVMINQRQKMEGIERFVDFYLQQMHVSTQ